MNKTKVFQYSILIIIGLLINYQFLPIGDYCVGLFSVLLLLFLGGIFIIAFILISSINLYQKIKYKKKFDFIPIMIFIFFSFTTYCLMENEYNKFWTKEILIGKIENEHEPTNGSLKLYKNGTFEANMHYVDFSCTYTGDYQIQNEILKLERENIEVETDNYFTTEYKIFTIEKKLKPLKKDYKEIEIVEE